MIGGRSEKHLFFGQRLIYKSLMCFDILPALKDREDVNEDEKEKVQ